MAGRFLLRQLSSRMSRPTSLLGAHSSASAKAGEPVTRRACVWEDMVRMHIHGPAPAAHHTTPVAPSSSGIHAYATRYFNTFACTRAVSKTGRGSQTSTIPPVIALKPAFVNSVGVKRAFSSRTSTHDTITNTAEWDAKLAACRAEVKDWFAKKKAEDDAFIRELRIFVGSWCLILWGGFSMLDSGPSHSGINSCEGKSGSHCQAAAGANLAVKNQ